jgi:hypothetical protein
MLGFETYLYEGFLREGSLKALGEGTECLVVPKDVIEITYKGRMSKLKTQILLTLL